MKYLKQLLWYGGWGLAAILLGIVYMRVILGANNVPKQGFGYIHHMFYSWGLFHVGLVIGLVIALFFILLDVFYLKKKLENNGRSTAIRFGWLLIITLTVGIIHYVLEKVIDVI